MTMENIRQRSAVLKEMENDGSIAIVGGMYDIADGSVTFYQKLITNKKPGQVPGFLCCLQLSLCEDPL